MVQVVHQQTFEALQSSMATIVDWVNPAGELTIVYYLMTTMPKALGLDKDVKRTASHK
jgi:hypothetical protein